MGLSEKDVFERLLRLRDEGYAEFAASLIPNVDNVLGVRLPKLRQFAKELQREGFEGFSAMPATFMEMNMIDGMLIGLLKESPEVIIAKIEKFLPRIDNWSVCDSFCCGLKFCKQNREKVWEFIMPLLKSEREYYVRFALVMMLNYFVEDDYVDRVLELAVKVRHEGYYAKMALAWLLSVCYVKFPEKVEEILAQKTLAEDVQTKTVRKICESLRVSAEAKKSVKKFLYKSA